MPEAETKPILVLVRDLMFSGRIIAEARAAGATIKSIRDPNDLSKLTELDSTLLVADLNLPGAIPAAAEWRKTPNRTVVGFVSHVDAETIAEAKAAGIDQVLARSRFVQILPDLLRKR
jgi:hypothetical protein